MDHLRYRLETLPAALNTWKMPRKTNDLFKVKSHGTWVLLAGLITLAVVVQESKPPPVALETAPQTTDTSFLTQLAGARIDTAKLKLEQNRPDEALALLISALKEDASSTEARNLVESILNETIWNLPEITLKHPLPIDQIAFVSPSSLWVSLAGEKNTTARWNLETLAIESVLFPTEGGATRSLVLDPTSQFLVVERKSVTLLCNAKSLKPIRDLGLLPDDLTPSTVIVFSEDGLLMAHPAWVSAADHSIIWQIRDTATGEVIRTTDPSTRETPQPLAAFLDRDHLRILNEDSSLLEIPVSPVAPVKMTAMSEPLKLLQAQFSANGNSALTLQDRGPHQPPTQSIISYREEDESLKTDKLMLRFPWSRHPNMWTGLMKDPEHLSFTVEDHLVKIMTNPHAPISSASLITTIAFDLESVIIGEENGTVTVHRLLPLPEEIPSEHEALPIDESCMKSLENLARALAGIYYDERERTFSRSSYQDRLKAFAECDFDAIFAIYPRLDFSTMIDEFTTIPSRTANPSAFLPLTDRIARAGPADPSSPGLAEVITAFQSGNSAAVLAAIQSAGVNGPAIANALALALKSDHPEWIHTCLAQAKDLPPILHQISQSRIAWLQGRTADALSSWTDVFPDLRDTRLREDWDGWEQADFTPALDQLSQRMKAELAAIRIPKNSTPAQRKAIADHLAAPGTLATVSKPRYAAACLELALLFSSFSEELDLTAKLARVARNLGAPAETSLRTEAVALTALGDFKNARTRWVELITEYPVETHLPADYTEAAYTAFENDDSKQAIEILNTGLRRFSENADFALRAGWVALITGTPERAYHFLRVGKRIGFPPDKLEYSTALLVIAASQAGAMDEAATYFQDLLLINPDWEFPETVDAFDWPEEFKSTIREFNQIPVTPDLLPELAPTNP
jgi:tetratricopeptide (TPR) repeat protein